MQHAIKLVAIVAIFVMLSACSTMQPPRYSVSVDNVQKLKQYQGAQIGVVSLNQSAIFSANCRLMGTIEPADGLSIPQFIAKAINDELKIANIYSADGIKLTGDVSRIKFSSITGLTSGYWDIALSLQSSNGNTLSVSNKYNFKSGFDAITACNATADALTHAVQDLLTALFNHYDFEKLIK